MIRIERCELPDCRLKRDGEEETLEMIAAWRRDPAGFRPAINNDIYGSAKDTLVAMQSGKCCYCETRINPGFYGDVEHFRPKKAVAGDDDHPGYWWLAYDWSNLLLSCKRCNVGHKRNHFSLTAGSTRAYSPDDALEGEAPLLVNPAEEDPSEHIAFRQHMAVGLTPKGDETIEVVGLNRDASHIRAPESGERIPDGLVAERRRHYQLFRKLYRWLDAERQSSARAEEMWQEILQRVVEPREPYLGHEPGGAGGVVPARPRRRAEPLTRARLAHLDAHGRRARRDMARDFSRRAH